MQSVCKKNANLVVLVRTRERVKIIRRLHIRGIEKKLTNHAG